MKSLRNLPYCWERHPPQPHEIGDVTADVWRKYLDYIKGTDVETFVMEFRGYDEINEKNVLPRRSMS